MQTTFGISNNTRMEIWQLPNDPRRECIDWINCKNIEYSAAQIPTDNISVQVDQPLCYVESFESFNNPRSNHLS